jgi:hypothetical protein
MDAGGHVCVITLPTFGLTLGLDIKTDLAAKRFMVVETYLQVPVGMYRDLLVEVVGNFMWIQNPLVAKALKVIRGQ